MFGMEEQHAAVLKLTMDKMDAHTKASLEYVTSVVWQCMRGKTAFPF